MERWLLLAVLSLGWGSSYLFQNEAVAEASPLTVSAIRLTAAAALLIAGLAWTGAKLPRDRTAWVYLALIGLVGNLLPFTLITWAQEAVKSSVAGILTAIVPLITLVLAHFFADERLTLRRGAGFVLGFLGVAVLLGPQALEGGGDRSALLAYAALVAAAFCFAVTAILAGRMPQMPPMAAAAGVLLAAAAMTAPLAVLQADPLSSRITLDAIGSVAVLALVITPWATYAYFRLVRVAGPSFLSLFNYFNPLVATAGGVLVLGERLPSTAGWALLLILAGVALSELRRLARLARSAAAP